MTIRIVDDSPEIVLTRDECARLAREYQRSRMVDRPTFEQFVRSRTNQPVTGNPAHPLMRGN